jgi:hypothetical protein
MDDHLVLCVVSMPKVAVGEVAGELNRRGALLDDFAGSGKAISIHARIPHGEVASFRTWLATAVGDAARIDITE